MYVQLIKYCFEEVNLVVFELALYFKISHKEIAKSQTLIMMIKSFRFFKQHSIWIILFPHELLIHHIIQVNQHIVTHSNYGLEVINTLSILRS